MKATLERMKDRLCITMRQVELRQLERIAHEVLDEAELEEVKELLSKNEISAAKDYLCSAVDECFLEKKVITESQAARFYRILAIPKERLELLRQKQSELKDEREALKSWKDWSESSVFCRRH